MKSDAIKLRLRNFGDKLLDMAFPKENLMNKFAKSTAKFWVYQNIDKIDPYLSSFEDSNGEIDTDTLMQIYEENLFMDGKLRINISEFLPDNQFLRSVLPNQIVLDKEDLQSILTQKDR